MSCSNKTTPTLSFKECENHYFSPQPSYSIKNGLVYNGEIEIGRVFKMETVSNSTVIHAVLPTKNKYMKCREIQFHFEGLTKKQLEEAKTFLPKRTQRKRSKGWKMPENTKYVGRPSKWGNPFKVGEESPFLYDEILQQYGQSWSEYPTYIDTLNVLKYSIRGHEVEDNEAATILFREYLNWLQENKPTEYKQLIEPLKGKNLACWCKIGTPCHVDVLIEKVNE